MAGVSGIRNACAFFLANACWSLLYQRVDVSNSFVDGRGLFENAFAIVGMKGDRLYVDLKSRRRMLERAVEAVYI